MKSIQEVSFEREIHRAKSTKPAENTRFKIVHGSRPPQSILLNISPFAPHTGQIPGAAFSDVNPQTGQI